MIKITYSIILIKQQSKKGKKYNKVLLNSVLFLCTTSTYFLQLLQEKTKLEALWEIYLTHQTIINGDLEEGQDFGNRVIL